MHFRIEMYELKYIVNVYRKLLYSDSYKEIFSFLLINFNKQFGLELIYLLQYRIQDNYMFKFIFLTKKQNKITISATLLLTENILFLQNYNSKKFLIYK